MPTWVSSVIIPVCVSVAGTIATAITVGPRLAARGKRIQAYHDARDQYTNSILDILAVCANVRGAVVSDNATEHQRSAFQAELDRWESQIGDITMWLVDHWQRFALGYVDLVGVQDLITSYAATARGIWISARPLQERVRMLQDLSQPMAAIFVQRRWRALPQIPGEADRIRKMIDSLAKPADSERPYGAPEVSRNVAASEQGESAAGSELAGAD